MALISATLRNGQLKINNNTAAATTLIRVTEIANACVRKSDSRTIPHKTHVSSAAVLDTFDGEGFSTARPDLRGAVNN